MEVQIKPEYRKQAFYTILSIVFFMLSFVFILTLTLVISYFSFKMGLFLLKMFLAENLGIFNVFILLFGLGFLSFGFFISAYTFKFLFQNKRVDLSMLKEVKRKEEPLLFEMIEDLVKEIGTHFPNKIYLSPDVNAFVFYNQGMINMFLPSRKNLVIGLGLVNVLSEDELKSVLAHEFGHFSQNSMRVGSYSTNLENIVLKILFKNENLNQMFKHVLVFNWITYFFGFLVIPYIKFIEWSLIKSFNFVQINNRALSREMEFHADAVAANVSGTKIFQSALMKMEFSHLAFNEAQKYMLNLELKKKKPERFYELHTIVIKAMCMMNDLEFKNGLPVIQIKDINRINHSKLYIRDKFATHPEMMDRIKHLDELNITKTPVNSDPAMKLFQSKDVFDQVGMNQSLSQTTFDTEQNDEMEVINMLETEEMYIAEMEQKKFDPVYSGYFDYRNIDLSVWDIAESMEIKESLTFDQNLVDTTKQLDALNQDKMAIINISSPVDYIKEFNYNGIKYSIHEFEKVIDLIEDEIKATSLILETFEMKLFSMVKYKANEKGQSIEVENLINELRTCDEVQHGSFQFINKLSHNLSNLSKVENENDLFVELRAIKSREVTFKRLVKELLSDPIIIDRINEWTKVNLNEYLSTSKEYVSNSMISEEELELLPAGIDSYIQLLSVKMFSLKQMMLNKMAKILA